MEKIFLAIWGVGYSCIEATSGTALVEEHTADWFSVDRGYEPELNLVLDRLVIGECLNLSDISGIHNIIRIK